LQDDRLGLEVEGRRSVSSGLRARLLALQDALGELLAAAGAPGRLRRVDERPYRLVVPGIAAELSAVRLPIAAAAAPAAGARLPGRNGRRCSPATTGSKRRGCCDATVRWRWAPASSVA